MFSLTDHDTTAGVHEVEDDIPGGGGIQRNWNSPAAGDTKRHVLGYSYDDNHLIYESTLAAAEAKREDKMTRIEQS